VSFVVHCTKIEKIEYQITQFPIYDLGGSVVGLIGALHFSGGQKN
jgi:hypothetical protein